ncbi:EF-hand calcium-binding domain-containing protein 5 [Ambystoma mexicanum]|uniref:EF-hand calcium-binding domain-containing protein 5 n=1 Tax=Ambystoma mexicanum TaxID=8296 RepID=UPI0037E7F92E
MSKASRNRKPEPASGLDCEDPTCETAAGGGKRSRRPGEPDDGRWKQNFFDRVQQRGLDLQQTTTEVFRQVRAEEAKLRQKEALDPLAREWHSADKETAETRAYLLEKLLPALVPGVEKLLLEAEKRQLLDVPGLAAKFNPVNFLAETLMRSNAQVARGGKATPYARGLKEVVKDLKSQVLALESSRLAQLKQEMKEAQEQRVKLAGIDAQVKEKRKEALTLQFAEWTRDASGRIPVALVQNALKSFLEVASRFPVEPKLESYSKDLATDETLEHKLNGEEYVEYVHSYTQDLSTDMFLELLHHLAQSADAFRETIRHDRWRQMFIDLFLACDPGKTGVLDRQRVLLLLETFYDSEESEAAGWGLRNPRHWPMIEFREMDPTGFWADFEEGPNVPEEEDLVMAMPSSVGLAASDIPSGTWEQGGPQAEGGVDYVVDQPSVGELTATQAEMSKSAEVGVLVLTVSTEGQAPMRSASMPILQENINTNAGSDEPVEDPAGVHTQDSAILDTTDPSLDVQNGVPERSPRATMQSISGLRDMQRSVEEVMLDQPATARENGAEDPGSTTVSKEVLQKRSSSVIDAETKASEDQRAGEEDVADQLRYVDGIPWSGDLLTTDLALKYGSYGDKSQDEWSVAASKYTDLRSIITDIHAWEPPRVTSAFNGTSLNLPQFVQLMETFLGEDTPPPVVERLVIFIREGYMETEEEKFQRLEMVRHDAFSAKRRLVLEALFQKWDNEGSGFMDLSELEAILSKYKEGLECQALNRGRERLKSAKLCPDDAIRINSRDFQRYIESLMQELPGTEEESFESLVDFLTTSIDRTQSERLRGAMRRKWLHEIQRAAESSGGSLEPVHQAALKALYKDAEAHGNKKRICASIGLLEQSPAEENRGPVLLRYVACTLEDAPYVLNNALYRDMKGVSFSAVDQGKPVHVPRVQYHGNVQFWKHDRPAEERTGSFLVLPLKDKHMRVFGTLGIDTIRDPRERNLFLTHEISFYQGVSNTFSEAYHYVQIRSNILLLVSSALAWIHNRAPNIQSVTTYLMEPGTDKVPDYVLRKAMTTDSDTGLSEIHPSPPTLRRKENLFRDYLFKCADSSEVITTDAYGERHIAVPIREPSGRALVVVDVSTGQCRDLPAHEFQDLQKMLQMLQAACDEILGESEEEKEMTYVLEAERIGEASRLGVLFHRFMLQDLRECVQKLDYQSFAELKSYKEPPTMIHNILRAVLLLFNPHWAESEEVESWSQCKLKVNTNLVRRITTFDPTARSVQVHPELVAKYIKGIPRGAVWRHGSIPAEYLYNWAFTCVSLLELNPITPVVSEPSAVPSATEIPEEQTEA